LKLPEKIWNIAEEHFPGATQIVDLYHARQHLWEFSSKLFPSDRKQRLRWAKQTPELAECRQNRVAGEDPTRFSPTDWPTRWPPKPMTALREYALPTQNPAPITCSLVLV
jgi:hypothetical protein